MKDLYLKDYGVRFTRAKNGFFEPILRNIKKTNNGEMYGIEIVKGRIYYDFLMYIKYSERKIINTGKNIGQIRTGFAEIYQYIFAFKALSLMEKMNSDKLIATFARQAGKSWISRKVIAFLLIFYAHHYDLGIHDRFFLTFANLKKEAVKGQLLKLLPEIRKAIECYNMLYPHMYIEWKETPKEKKIVGDLPHNDSMILFNRVIDGVSLPYAQMDIISLNSKVISAGLTSHCVYIDELQDISYEWVSKQAIPFLASTGGVMIGTGTANTNTDGALFNYYKTKTIPDENKMILDWEEVYKFKKYVSEKHANKYKQHVQKEIEEKGINSKSIQTEYYCNFNINTDRFLVEKDLYDNNMLTEDIEDNISHYTDKNIYRIGALDPALSGDRCAFGTAISGMSENFTWTKAKNFEVIKELNEVIDPDSIIKQTVDFCVKNQLDYLIVDNTASQRYLTIPLYKALIKKTKTQIIPLDISGFREKVKMCRYGESLIFQQAYKLPKDIYLKQNKGFKYTIDELLTLVKKKNSTGEYSYKAEQGKNDDFAMVFFMLGYALEFLKESIAYNKKFQLGRFSHRLYLRKNTEDKKEKKVSKKSWLGF